MRDRADDQWRERGVGIRDSQSLSRLRIAANLDHASAVHEIVRLLDQHDRPSSDSDDIAVFGWLRNNAIDLIPDNVIQGNAIVGPLMPDQQPITQLQPATLFPKRSPPVRLEVLNDDRRDIPESGAPRYVASVDLRFDGLAVVRHLSRHTGGHVIQHHIRA